MNKLVTTKLDFIQLRGVTNHVNKALTQDTWNLYHVGLLLVTLKNVYAPTGVAAPRPSHRKTWGALWRTTPWFGR